MTYNGKNIDEPTIEMIQEYINLKGFKNLSAEDIFNRYQGNGWRTIKGTPVVSIETVVNIFNGLKNPNSSKKRRLTYRTEKYKELLQNEEWKAFREKVLEIHEYKCDICGEIENLQVHHKSYRKNGMNLTLPWAYYFNEMSVLCEKHHAEAHNVKVYSKV